MVLFRARGSKIVGMLPLCESFLNPIVISDPREPRVATGTVVRTIPRFDCQFSLDQGAFPWRPKGQLAWAHGK